MTLVSMDLVVDELRKRGHDSAYVEQTGGGCATIYVGPTKQDPEGGVWWAATAGPGWWVPGGWQAPGAKPYMDSDDMYVGGDDWEGFEESCKQLDTTDVAAIADAIEEQVKATIQRREEQA